MRQKTNNFFLKFSTFLATKKFFLLILVFIVLQGGWYALSFKPILFDESHHFKFMQFYSERINPFIVHQNPEFDTLGEITREPNYVFYFVFGQLIRLISIFTINESIHLAFLRLVMLAFFVIGIILYKRFFDSISPKRALNNLTLLALVTIPAYAPFPGAVNYDNVTFAIVPLLLILLNRIINDNKGGFDASSVSLFVITGLIGILVKVNFAALFALIALYLVFKLIKKHGRELASVFKKGWENLAIIKRICYVIVLVIIGGLFMERHVQNVVDYSNVAPSCVNIISKERCMNNYTSARNITFRESKPEDFSPLNPIQFLTVLWFSGISTTSVRLVPETAPMPVAEVLYMVAILLGLSLILVYLRSFLQRPLFVLLIIAVFGYSLILFAENYRAYTDLGRPVAINSRYLLPVAPIFIFLAFHAIAELLRKCSPAAKSILFCIVALLVIQGGSIATLALTAPPDYYFQSSPTTMVNDKIKTIFQKLVLESNPFIRI